MTVTEQAAVVITANSMAYIPALDTYASNTGHAIAQALANAGLLARPQPSRDEIARTLEREFGSFLAHDPHNKSRFYGQAADAVLALLKDQT